MKNIFFISVITLFFNLYSGIPTLVELCMQYVAQKLDVEESSFSKIMQLITCESDMCKETKKLLILQSKYNARSFKNYLLNCALVDSTCYLLNKHTMTVSGNMMRDGIHDDTWLGIVYGCISDKNRSIETCNWVNKKTIYSNDNKIRICIDNKRRIVQLNIFEKLIYKQRELEIGSQYILQSNGCVETRHICFNNEFIAILLNGGIRFYDAKNGAYISTLNVPWWGTGNDSMIWFNNSGNYLSLQNEDNIKIWYLKIFRDVWHETVEADNIITIYNIISKKDNNIFMTIFQESKKKHEVRKILYPDAKKSCVLL